VHTSSIRTPWRALAIGLVLVANGSYALAGSGGGRSGGGGAGRGGGFSGYRCNCGGFRGTGFGGYKGAIQRGLGPGGGSYRVTSRTVGGGIDKNHHNMSSHVEGYRSITYQRHLSGQTTASFRAKHSDWRNMSHTEVKALAKGTKFDRPVHRVMTGTKPPCKRCQGAIRKNVERTGDKETYRFREGGQTVRYTYERMPDGTVQRTISRGPSTKPSSESKAVHNGQRWKPMPPAPEK
jgi:hypothetical protein